MWRAFTSDEQVDAPLQTKASICGISEEDFIFFSKVVEAESDRSDNFEGKVLIAETIWNRANSSDWPSTIRKCITQDGQFTVYLDGIYKSVDRTDLSDMAIVEAYCRIEEGTAPNVIYFNCISYNHLGTPYCYEGGNYFETVP